MFENMDERFRLSENDPNLGSPWYKWGPYISERSWGTAREDYSPNGDAWNYFSFDLAHKKVFRWGEDAIAGWCDRYQILAFAPVFWNGRDPILKERLFGLNPYEGNHSEDVKEYYYHLDATPTHSYMSYLYKYPQNPFPYQLLREENAKRGLKDPEYELVDTGIFQDKAYFDIVIEYAMATNEDTCIQITAHNRGSKSAPLHILPHLWFRNQWGWGDVRQKEPTIALLSSEKDLCLIADDENLNIQKDLSFDYRLGKRYLYAQRGASPLFTNNENSYASPYSKDAFHRFLIEKNGQAINPDCVGTKAALHYVFDILPNQTASVRLRLTDRVLSDPFSEIGHIFSTRKQEADAFYKSIFSQNASKEECQIQRQAIAGMIWNKQLYLYDVDLWLKGDNRQFPPPESRKKIRNEHWKLLNSKRVISMPDKWEYPWFAAWDLAFHTLTLGLIDIQFAKRQLMVLILDQFQNPNGAIPAYEWNFGDFNPTVHAWAALRLFDMEKEQTGKEDYTFLKTCFLKLLLNFTFLVNQVDSSGCNVFEGGFLGLDNISLLDRSESMGDNVYLKQSDGTGWMAMFALNLMRIALKLAKIDHSYEVLATKFFQHFIQIAYATKTRDNKPYSLWDAQDRFFYDVLVYPDGQFAPFRIRSFVGIIPLFAVDIITKEELEEFPYFKSNFIWSLQNLTHATDVSIYEQNHSYLLSFVNQDQFQNIMQYVRDPNEFWSPFGIRSLSKFHEDHPFIHNVTRIGYEPGDSIHKIKGGNSNWRGPIWFPLNYLLIQSLKTYSIHFPEATGIAKEISENLVKIFKRDENGKRTNLHDFSLDQDPHFKDLHLYHEFFHGDTGKGLGASHQTGWTGLVANLINELRK